MEDFGGRVDAAMGLLSAGGAGAGLNPAAAAAAAALAASAARLKELAAPRAANEAMRACVQRALGACVGQLCGPLAELPAALVAHEAWAATVAHAGGEPVTATPLALRDALVVALSQYQALLGACAPAGPPPPDASWRPLQAATLGALAAYERSVRAGTERLRLALDAAEAAGGGGGGGASPSKAPRPKRGRRSEIDVGAAARHEEGDSPGGGGGAGAAPPHSDDPKRRVVGAGAGAHLSDDAKLLVLVSNTRHLREQLLASITARYGHLLAGAAPEEQRALRAAGRATAAALDALAGHLLGLYLRRKRGQISALLGGYVAAGPGAPPPVGAPPALVDASEPCHGLLGALSRVCEEVNGFAPSQLAAAAPPLLEHAAEALAARCAQLPGDTPLEALAQYYLDASFFEAVAGQAEAPGVQPALDAARDALAARVADAARGARAGGGGPSGRAGASGGGPPPPATALARALVGGRGRGEAEQRLQALCARALPDLLQRAALNVRCFAAVALPPSPPPADRGGRGGRE
jgi:hypothetical protein